MWASRWHLGKLYLQETPLCHEMANGYCQCCSLAWVCGKLWNKEELDKVCQMLWEWSRVLICRQFITRVRTVCTFTSACNWCATTYSTLGKGGGIKGDLCPGKGTQESMQPQVGLHGDEVSTAAPHLMTEVISYWEELCGLGLPWSRAPFKSLELSVPAPVMLQQCWSPWPCWGRPMS